MNKVFNITGSCNPDKHYMVNLDSRLMEIRACSHKNSIKNHSEHDDSKKNDIEFIITSENFSETF